MTLNKLTLIGLTGGIGTGKSTVTNILKGKGYNVLDADKISREVVEKGKPGYQEIVEEFGESILLDDGNLDRKSLGNIIFRNEKQRKKLNEIIHPYIFKRIEELKNEISKNNNILFLDIPLLFEEYNIFREYNIVFDEIWLVYANRKTQVSRIMKRDSISEKDALDKINSQIDIEDKKCKASEILDNSGKIEELEKQVDKLLKRL